MDITELEELGYRPVRRLHSGEIAGVMGMAYTVGLFVGLDNSGYRTRFCYPNRSTAEEALKGWDGYKDPPGPWIKEKGRIERSNPNGSVPKARQVFPLR